MGRHGIVRAPLLSPRFVSLLFYFIFAFRDMQFSVLALVVIGSGVNWGKYPYIKMPIGIWWCSSFGHLAHWDMFK